MIILLDTSTPLCKLTLLGDSQRYDYEWQADRQLALGLLAYIQEKLQHHNGTWSELTGIGVFQGPGSFTGLRIGLTVLNTLADSEQVPIVGEQGEGWQQKALERLRAGENDRMVLPHYGSEAHITKPRK